MDIVTILSTVATVVVAVGTATYWLGSRLTGVERDVESLKRDVEALRSEVRSGFNRLANVITSANEIMIGYLGLRGVLNQNEAASNK